MLKTNKDLALFLRILGGIVSFFNLICAFFAWQMVANIFIILRQINMLNLHISYFLIDVKTAIIILVVFFILDLIALIAFWNFSYHIKDWQVKKYMHLNLFFVIPFGFLTFYYVINNSYWKLENPNVKLEKIKVSLQDIKQIKQENNLLKTVQEEKLIKKVKSITDLIAIEYLDKLDFLAQKIFNLNKWNLVDLNKAKKINLLMLKAICEQVEKDSIDLIQFNVPWIENKTFNFCSVAKKIKSPFQFLQAYIIVDRQTTSYEELIELKSFVKKNKKSVSSLFVGIYTNKIYKIFLNFPKKG